MTNKEIKSRMKMLYIAMMEKNDDSYNKLYDALHTLMTLDLIPYEQWKMVIAYDNTLFEEIEKEDLY